ncbi:amino-acid N-acetyltransferase [Luminiphilus syltensis NOR5-1B]|uniref:Amino-acid acetyltransferase n=1 Tax=Luminiphilus syltensis NOR5-1B TaxID=565045 RepID=B8KUK3_9GAMM|nr:amino-acid N-acetyltransferase [Luminiphilus syltensis]EED35650.1 amino-acid N-acetyltransferase [Luminiphilus syltensis NOR5-1B]
MSLNRPTIDWFRHTVPYMKAHRGRTFVVYLGNGALAEPHLTHLIHDFTLLHTLGIRLVLVPATRAAIESKLESRGIESHLHSGIRITDSSILDVVTEVTATQRLQLETRLSMGLPDSPMRGSRLRVISGNFVTARPLGVVDGIDFQYTGAVRRIDAAGVISALDQEGIVLLSPMGFSPTGEIFNLSSDELATAAAISIRADKLILLDSHRGLLSESGDLIAQCTVSEARSHNPVDPHQAVLRDAACLACEQGVPRAHILNHNEDGVLIEELFTHDGAGTLISEEAFERCRPATADDIAGVLELVRPLEDKGVLVRRSRERLEQEIPRFRVLERDGRIIACAALYTFPDTGQGEIACIAIDPGYRGGQRGQRLLETLEAEAKAQQLTELFVLTTQTTHWFVEQGFAPASLSLLPDKKQTLYNLQRNSKVLVKALN